MSNHPLSLKHVGRAAAALLLFLNCGAASNCDEAAECRPFRDLSFQARAERIRAAPIEEQLDLYKCGMYTHPPDDYAGEIARGGAKNIPVVLERLKAEESETHQNDLIHVFEEMAKEGHLKGRRDIADQIKGIISAMKFNEIKAEARKRLETVEAHL